MGEFDVVDAQAVVYPAMRDAQYPMGVTDITSVHPKSLRSMDKGLYKRAYNYFKKDEVTEMNILKTKAGKQLVAKVGVKKAKKLIRQEMTSKMVSTHRKRQGYLAARAQRTRQTREPLTSTDSQHRQQYRWQTW